MCSVSTNCERASPAQQGSQLIGCHFPTTFDKHANILVKLLPEYQELVHISGHNKYSYTYYILKSPDNPAADKYMVKYLNLTYIHVACL